MTPPQHPRPRRISILGMPVDAITARQLLDHISAELVHGRGGWVFTPNLEILRMLVADPKYAALTAPATFRVADGMPLVWASRLQRTPLPERVAGSELVWSLTERAAREGRSVFLLGGNPGVAELAAAELKRRYPALRLLGTECPPFGFERDAAYMPTLAQRLRSVRPDICFVALNAVKQDHMIHSLRSDLPGTWFLGIGISLSFVMGEVRQAPRWVRRLGLEWAHRLCQEPRRLARRYLLHGVPFAVRLLASSTWRGLRHPVREA